MTAIVPVAILGATGSVGQRFIQLLANHPWFRVHEVVASDRSAGKPYGAAADWRLDTLVPDDIARLTVKSLGAELEGGDGGVSRRDDHRRAPSRPPSAAR